MASDVKELIKKYSIPMGVVRSDADERFAGGGHVAIVYADGELTLTKAGSLFGQRSFHCQKFGHDKLKLPTDWFPYQSSDGKFGRVFCTFEDAKWIQAAVATAIYEGMGVPQ